MTNHHPVVGILVIALGSLLAAASAQEGAIPAAARGPAIDQAKGYLVEEIRDGLYWVTEGSYQAIFLTTGAGVVLVDAPPTIGPNLLAAIAEVTTEPVTHLVYSHSHTDHIGAAGLMPEGITIVAHADVASQLARSADPNRPLPTVTFEDEYTLEVGSQKLELSYKGANHEQGNIFIYAPAQRVLMLVDVIFPGWVPFKDLALAEDVPGFIEAHDQVLGYEFDTFVGGHLTRLGTREDVEVQRDYIMQALAHAAEANGSVDFFAIAETTGFENQWLLFDTYFDAVAQACTDATLADWKDRLGGAEVFTFGHCWHLAESLRID